MKKSGSTEDRPASELIDKRIAGLVDSCGAVFFIEGQASAFDRHDHRSRVTVPARAPWQAVASRARWIDGYFVHYYLSAIGYLKHLFVAVLYLEFDLGSVFE